MVNSAVAYVGTNILSLTFLYLIGMQNFEYYKPTFEFMLAKTLNNIITGKAAWEFVLKQFI